MPHLARDSHGPVPRGGSLQFSKGASGASSECFIPKAGSQTYCRPESETLGVHPAACVVTSPPGDSDAHPSLRTSAPRFPYQQPIQETSRPRLSAPSAAHCWWSLSLESSPNLIFPTPTPDPLWSVPCSLGTLPPSVPHPRPDSVDFHALLCVFLFFTRR